MFHAMMITMSLMVMLGLTLFASSPNVRDALLKITRALPSSTTLVTSATGMDTGVTTSDAFQTGAVEFLLTAPVLTTTQLPDTKVMSYNIITSPNSDMSSATIRIVQGILQTGAGAAGAAAATYRFRMASDWGRYVGYTVTPSAAGTGDASGASATLEMLA